MRAAYNAGTVDAGRRHVNKIEQALARENIPANDLKWVELSSQRVHAEHDTLCRALVHSKSGALIPRDIKKKRDGNLPFNKLRSSEILLQTFA